MGEKFEGVGDGNPEPYITENNGVVTTVERHIYMYIVWRPNAICRL